jgi:O-methyltransferase involved in polyketide biosynthesis
LLNVAHTTDRLEEAVCRGIRQYILLGPDWIPSHTARATWTHDLAIVEIDHPASQQFNVAILSRAGVAVPGNLRFLAIDFGVDAAAGSVMATRLRKWQHLA